MADFLNPGAGPPSVPFLASVASLTASAFSSPLRSPLHEPSSSSYLSPLSLHRRGPETLPTDLFTLVHAVRLAYLYHDVLYKSHRTRVGLVSRKATPGKGAGQVGIVQAVMVVLGLVFAGTTATAVLQGQKAPVLEPGSGPVAAVYT